VVIPAATSLIGRPLHDFDLCRTRYQEARVPFRTRNLAAPGVIDILESISSGAVSVRLLLACAVVAISPLQLAAQSAPNVPSRFGLAAGVAWGNSTRGVSSRVEFYPMGVARTFALRAEAGFRWTSTAYISTTTLAFGASRFEGTRQGADVTLGLTGLVTPWPKGRVSPYLLGGALAVQEWTRSMGAFLSSTGTVMQTFPSRSDSYATVAAVGGLGVRAALFGHALQLEARRYHRTTMVTLGADLRF
jgi:hypothetical protein